jgi:hypothetical protein
MGKIKNKVFGLVVSKNVTDSLADSIKDNNQAKFYLAQDKFPNDGQALDDVTIPNELTDRNVLIINGNRIQGVNQNDLSKLDAITDVHKLFKYKGSVETGNELLKKVPPEVEVGDVWNVEQECEIYGIKYPAYTNFVCSSVKTSIEGKPASSTWDSLGGVMQMGIEATVHNVGNTLLSYYTLNNIPISSFNIKVNRSEGLYIDDLNRIGLSLSSRRGLGIDPYNYLGIRLSTDKLDPINKEVSEPENSGLAFRNDGTLTIAIGEDCSNDNDCINGALVLGIGTDDRHGGLCISSKAMVNFINTNRNIRTYINSLIDAKLKAQ